MISLPFFFIMKKERDEHWMREALREAGEAFAREEIPVGAVIVLGDECLSRASDLRETTGDPTAHAEILALQEAALSQGDWRLEGCTLYVTLEPCAMCVGAALWSRIDRIVFGCREPKWGALGSVLHLLDPPLFPHKIQVTEGILAEESSQLLKTFFSGLRNQRPPSPNAPRGS